MADATLTTFRQNVAAALEPAFGFPFLPGRIEGPLERGNLGCVWPLGKEEDTGDTIVFELQHLRARAFYAISKRSSNPRHPFDPTPLETWADLFQTTLSAVQIGLPGVPGSYARVTAVSIDLDRQFTEAAIEGWHDNVFNTSA